MSGVRPSSDVIVVFRTPLRALRDGDDLRAECAEQVEFFRQKHKQRRAEKMLARTRFAYDIRGIPV